VDKFTTKNILESMVSETIKVQKQTIRNKRGKVYGKPNTTNKTSKIPQIELPKSKEWKVKAHKTTSPKPFGDLSVSKFAPATKDKPLAVAVGGPKTRPSQSPKANITKKIAPTNRVSSKFIPTAKLAGEYTNKMGRGNPTNKSKMKTKPNKPKYLVNKGTTTYRSPKEVKVSKKSWSNKVTQVKANSAKPGMPKDSPLTPVWQKSNTNALNVMESVQFVINGSPKSSFEFINKSVAKTLKEQYTSFGYDVKIRKTKNNRVLENKQLHRLMFETIDAHYNDVPSESRTGYKKAFNKFFELSQGNYNSIYESKIQFVETMKSAFNRIMEQAHTAYRKNLTIFEGLVRVKANEDIIDLDVVTQATNVDMALRNFRNEIIENYGFAAEIRHIFLEGTKYTESDIVEWKR